MNMLVLIFLMFSNCYAQWKLEWHDEFNSEVLDGKKWEIDVQDIEHCDNQNIGRQNCYTNSTRNVRLINGTLALTAIYEKTLNKYSTSAWIRSAVNFTYGRIDIRAALPRGQLLAPFVKLLSYKQKKRDGGARHNQAIILHNDQSQTVKNNIDLKNYNKYFKDYNFDQFYYTNENLADFHTYSFEWSDKHLIWKFDDHITNKLNITNYKSFINDPVVLSFYLRVGGNPFGNQKLTIEHASKWKCSAWIIDYVRYYKWIDDGHSIMSASMGETQQEQDRKSFDFCPMIMEEISPMKELVMAAMHGKMNIIALVSVICLLILMAVVPLLIWLVLRMRKFRETVNLRDDNENDSYDDIIYNYLNNQRDEYDQVDLKYNHYQDHSQYSEYDDTINLKTTNLYIIPDKPVVRMNKLSSAPDGEYVTTVANPPRCGHSYLLIDQFRND